MRLIDADCTDYLFFKHQAVSKNGNRQYAHGFRDARKIMSEQPTIDPIHAAGGCYCHECRYHESTEVGKDYCDLRESACTRFCGDGKRKDGGGITDV